MALATRIKSEESWRAVSKVHAIEQGKELSPNERSFWGQLGFARDEIRSEADAQTDADFERECLSRFQLRVADADGNLTPIATGDGMKVCS